MLDAAAPALALETLAVSTAFAPTSNDAPAVVAAPVDASSANTPPADLQIQTPLAIGENGVVTLELNFTDPDALDSHAIEIDWNDGNVEVFNVPSGDAFFTATHQYWDDNLTGAATDDYLVTARVTDGAGEYTEATANVSVLNVAPSNLQIAPIAPINENGVATLNLTFDDPGTLDSHTVEVDWGDGSAPQQYVIPVGDRAFSATHQYLDDNPPGTPTDDYAVNVRVVDDDLGEATAAAIAKVNNVAPSNIVVTPVASILAEGGQVSLSIKFTDPGAQDTHKVEINWGDGNTTIESVVGQAHSASHVYGDNGVYVVIVKVVDDDGGAGFGSAAGFVTNVAPSNVQINPIATIDENGLAVLQLTFDDPGMLDSHTVQVDWGDGTIETLPVVAGARTFTATHQYLDDNPTGTASDVYAVKATVTDDDGGSSAAATSSVTVQNVAPSNVVVTPVANILAEGGQVSLSISFDDPGSQDTHQVEINWGDGNTTIENVVGHAHAASHSYLDDGTYVITVKVVDDDGGVGFGSAAAFVSNVAPANLQIAPIAPINENGVATLTLTFGDPGTLDSHTVEVDWGDGSPPQQYTLPVGDRTLTATHQYLDDNPTGTASDSYVVTVKVTDDDGGSAMHTALAVVNNVAPTNVVAAPVASILDEGGQVSLAISFDDPGSQDTHTVEINWGDGNTTIASAVGQYLSASHTYADNGTYVIIVKVVDDDGGVGFGSAAAHVNNVAPTLTVGGDQTIDEGALLDLPALGQFTDPGFNNPLNSGNILNGGEEVESFTYKINWGDGSPEDSGAATSVINGGVGVPTTGAITGSHVYADNGVYTVTVTVYDDDGGESTKTFLVTVNNVDPSLTFANPNPTVDEGSAVTLDGLGVGVTDPGFNNSALGTNETFTGDTVDWGDGTGPVTLAITTTPGGGPTNAPTTGSFSHATHYYADNGTYTVTVRLRDDDGGFINRTFTIVVENVAPSLTLTNDVLVIDEGDTLTLPNLGTFSDPGFDNPANAGNGETEEFFHYTIDWGDGTGTSAPIAAAKVNGGPNVDTIGTLVGEHQYLDNDEDNKYTITVTLYDDDGGTVVKTIEVTVKNVSPKLNPIVATDVNSKGETTLNLEFIDPGQDEFTIIIDWGDNQLPEKVIIPAGATSLSFQYTHKYDEPPDPNNPTKDIKISVQILDDDSFKAGVDSNDPSNIESVEISLPGLGAEKFRIDTTPQVAILTFPDRQPTVLLTSTPEARLANSDSADVGGGGGDSRATSERYLELRVINPDGSPGEEFRLPSKVLSNLPALFRNLPDNHYAIYLVQSETNARRLVIEVFVRNGKLIDPGDDSEGARDRPPTEEATSRAVEEPAAAAPRGDEALPITPEAPTLEPQGAIELPAPPATPFPSSSTMYHRTTLAGAAIALSGAGRTWHKQLERALAQARPEQLKRLRTAGHRRPKKPR